MTDVYLLQLQLKICHQRSQHVEPPSLLYMFSGSEHGSPLLQAWA